MYDTLVIGGGPAGLQAALTLGRMRKDVLLVDSGEYRNGTVDHAHNLLTHDGRAPHVLLELGRKDVAAYPTVESRSARVESVSPDGDTFVAVVDGVHVRSRTVLVATGMRDVLPDVPGLADVWGVEAAQCPFCHGYEVADLPVVVLGAHGHTGPYMGMLRNVTADLTLVPNGAVLDDANAAVVAALGARVVEGRVTRVERVDGGVRLAVEGAGQVLAAGLFLAPEASVQAAPFAEQLGLDLQPSGAVAIDVFGRTSLPGVYAAGDLAHVAELPGPMPALAAAVAAGLLAGTTVVRDLLPTA